MSIGQGPLTIRGGNVTCGADGTPYHIEVKSSLSTNEARITLEDFEILYSSGYQCKHGIRISTFRGPLK